MHIDGYEHQDRAELEAQLCRANARAEAAEQHARELDYKLGLALHDSEQGIADANESEACLKAENDALRERFAASEADYAACAEAIGVVYEADGHATQPGPRDAVVEHIREAVRDAGRYHEAEGRSYELREKLAVATQGLQHIKAKTTNVMAMVWSEETLKKLGVE